MAALEEAKLRFALRLQVVDTDHPLARRIEAPMITRGRGTGTIQRPRTNTTAAGPTPHSSRSSP
ncbi:hypothetical protein N7486_001254 [Penicillium sp. IBT 16267x]|nr:hypothetical protein N7486_001254 [Penicillium sp. IBT 16267x]